MSKLLNGSLKTFSLLLSVPEFRKKEGNAIFKDALITFYFMVIWQRTAQRVREKTRCHHYMEGRKCFI